MRMLTDKIDKESHHHMRIISPTLAIPRMRLGQT
jgi:hypothetical protein